MTSLDDGRHRTFHGDGAGHWNDPLIEGCIDVDIQASPFTNTIAIRRLGLSPDQSAEIRAAFIEVPGFTAKPAPQRYKCRTPHRYRYEGLDTDFTAVLIVDDEGLVVDYTGWFKRVWPR